MGLDQYAYVAIRAGQMDEFWNTAEAAEGSTEFISNTVNRPREIAYWRKHPNLQGFMEKLWLRKQNIPHNQSDQFIKNQYPPKSFNGIEVELTWEDLEQLEHDIINCKLPATKGFFFGDDACAEYYNDDLEFIKNARAELFMGLKVFYNSSW